MQASYCYQQSWPANSTSSFKCVATKRSSRRWMTGGGSSRTCLPVQKRYGGWCARLWETRMRKAVIGTTTACFALAACGLLDGSRSVKSEAQQAVKSLLKDPDSATFRNVQIRERGNIDGQDQKLVCGEVNARGPMGGYVGYTRFVYGTAGKKAILGSPDKFGDQLAADLSNIRSICRETNDTTCHAASDLGAEYERVSQLERVWTAWCS